MKISLAHTHLKVEILHGLKTSVSFKGIFVAHTIWCTMGGVKSRGGHG